MTKSTVFTKPVIRTDTFEVATSVEKTTSDNNVDSYISSLSNSPILPTPKAALVKPKSVSKQGNTLMNVDVAAFDEFTGGDLSSQVEHTLSSDFEDVVPDAIPESEIGEGYVPISGGGRLRLPTYAIAIDTVKNRFSGQKRSLNNDNIPLAEKEDALEITLKTCAATSDTDTLKDIMGSVDNSVLAKPLANSATWAAKSGRLEWFETASDGLSDRVTESITQNNIKSIVNNSFSSDDSFNVKVLDGVDANWSGVLEPGDVKHMESVGNLSKFTPIQERDIKVSHVITNRQQLSKRMRA